MRAKKSESQVHLFKQHLVTRCFPTELILNPLQKALTLHCTLASVFFTLMQPSIYPSESHYNAVLIAVDCNKPWHQIVEIPTLFSALKLLWIF